LGAEYATSNKFQDPSSGQPTVHHDHWTTQRPFHASPALQVMNSSLATEPTEGIARVAFLGPPPGNLTQHLSTEESFKLVGNNTGNLVFWLAVDRHVRNSKYYIGWDFEPRAVRERADVFLIPASNFLHPARDLGSLADRIERTQLPTVVVGLGAQAPHRSVDLPLKAGTIRFAQLLSERSTSLGVRGEFTADVLSKLGIHNVSIIGCPGNLINLNPYLGHQVAQRLQEVATTKHALRVAANFDSHRAGLQAGLSHLAGLIREHEFSIVCQSPLALVRTGRGELRSMCKNTPEWAHLVRDREVWSMSSESDEAFARFAFQHHIVFFHAAAWLEHLRRYDVSVGTRIHGNLVALQAGVPALFLSHDARTEEIIETLGMPAGSWDCLHGCRSLQEFIASVAFSGEDYDSRRRQIAITYCDLLGRAQLATTPSLLKFADLGVDR